MRQVPHGATARWPKRSEAATQGKCPRTDRLISCWWMVAKARWLWPARFYGSGFEPDRRREKGGTQGRLEELVFADGRDKVIWADSAALMLIAQIRDEAHRFASPACAQRAKVRMVAAMEEIPHRPQAPGRCCSVLGGCGRGMASAKILFGGGISRELADEIYGALH